MATYPWKKLQFDLVPQTLISSRRTTQAADVPSPSPFPRYGHSLCARSNESELFIFGGLVGDNKSNELYCFSSLKNSVSLWQTEGDVPSPRVGHASAVISSVLIVWGGDAELAGGRIDDALYLLNLSKHQCLKSTILP